MPKKRLVIDAGAGDGSFVQAFRRRNKRDRIIGIDHDPSSKARIKQSIGQFFRFDLKDPERVKSVRLNHVNFYSAQGLKEMREMVAIIPKGTPVMIIVRKKYLQQLKRSLIGVGLEFRSEKPWTPKMPGSNLTKKFYEEAQKGMEDNTPIKVVTIKPK